MWNPPPVRPALSRTGTLLAALGRAGRHRLALIGLLTLVLSSALWPVAVAGGLDQAALTTLFRAALERPSASTATTWYFAEGYTGTGFDEYLTINNPESTGGTATITYYVEDEATPTVRTVTLPGNSRVTVAVHAPFDASTNPGGLGRKSKGHATKLVATVPVVVERPMYFTYGAGITGGHNVLGTTAPDTTWIFAEGYTGTGFDEYLTINNPDSTAGTATITYYVENEATPTVRTVVLPASSRVTVMVHGDYNASTNPGGLGRKTAGHSTKVVTTVPTVIERPMYFTYGGTITGGHNVMGSPGRPEPLNCRVVLLGTNEVPPVVTTGLGEVRLTIHPVSGKIDGEWLVSGLSSNLTAAHIHEAAVGVNGPIRVNFGSLPTTGGAFSTTTTTSTAQAAAIAANPSNFYVNVHTTTNSGGELRGQLTCTPPVVCVATLLGANEVPAVSPAGSGSVRLRFDAANGIVRGEWLVAGQTSNLTAAHIHQGAAGAIGPPRVNFTPEINPAGGIFATATSSTTPQLEAILANPSGFYVNVHTVNNTDGEMRGQLSCGS